MKIEIKCDTVEEISKVDEIIMDVIREDINTRLRRSQLLGDAPCHFNGMEEYCDKWCEENCWRADEKECWIHAIQERWYERGKTK